MVKPPGDGVDQLVVARPSWLDWSRALRALDQEIRQPGEHVRPDEGTVTTPCLLADRPLAVTVTSNGDTLVVSPSTPGLAELVTRRFHLDLDWSAVSAAFDRSGLVDVLEPNTWVRRPAAADFWSYCLTFLCGGDPDAPSVRRLFAELGQSAGELAMAPGPTDLLAAGDRRIISYGIAPHRVANVLGLACAFAARPERYDEIAYEPCPPTRPSPA